MAGETTITVIGNLTSDPELRFTPQGKAVASFTVASTPRTFDRASGEWKDGQPLFLRCSLWGEPGENAAESLSKGMRVIAQGKLSVRQYETKDGRTGTSVELEVEEVGPSLRFASAQVVRAPGRGQGTAHGSGGGFGGEQQAQPGDWSTEPPF